MDSVCLIAHAQVRVGALLVPVFASIDEEGGIRAVETLNVTLPAYCRLESPKFVDRLPLTALGKVDYADLAELLRDSETSRLPKLK